MLLDKDIERVFYSKEQIQQRVKELGQEITAYYQGKRPIVVGILKGATPFFADLIENIDLYISIDFMIASSYNGKASSGLVNIVKDIEKDIAGQDIILVEDIIDSGLTMKVVKEMLLSRGANSVKLAALLDKKEARKYDVEIDWCGFNVENQFVVGYGLDYNETYRNLPYIGILKEEIYKK